MNKTLQHKALPFVMLFCALTLTKAQNTESGINNRRTIEKDNNGNVTTYLMQAYPQKGEFEAREVDSTGKTLQWYQHFVDDKGREIISIQRTVLNGPGYPPYETIQFIVHFQYNANNNVSESFELDGTGVLISHKIYNYDKSGNWIGGSSYDANGKLKATILTAPVTHLYGKWKGN